MFLRRLLDQFALDGYRSTVAGARVDEEPGERKGLVC